MITIVYSTHKDKTYNSLFKDHLIRTVGLKEYEILEYQNNNEYSLAEIYNKGISKSKYDIVVCIHNDISLENGWGKKLLRDFQINPEYSIIGKAGSCYFPTSGVYWERMNQTMVGQVYHHPDGQKKWINRYCPKFDFLIPVVTIDGLFMAFDKTKIKHSFDESIGKFHFYDHGFCVPNYLDGVKIGVTSSFEITHRSVGKPNQEFFESKDKFVSKYSKVLPLDLKPNFIQIPENKKIIKKNYKVAIIIPTKSKLDLLFNCIDSIFANSNPLTFHIFIADTGSSYHELEQIKNKISQLSNITLVNYDYYNFAKINNDVVKNYIGNEYEFLLFCNNDIKLLNDVIGNMVNVFKEKPLTGTVGCRLHFGDNTIQHDGIFVAHMKKNNSILVSHHGLFSYYNYTNYVKPVIGNTGALLMIRRNTFIKCGMFNENYTTCFEDVELNLKCISMGLENYFDGRSVAYHYESQTRGKTESVQNQEMMDMNQLLIPFIHNNINKFSKYIINLNQ
jgi:GT2 family glycosyltransferase